MKISKKISAAILVCLTATPILTGCSDDNKKNQYPDDFAFEQVLRVEQWNDGTTNAFANFMAVNMDGIKVSVQLPQTASIFCGGKQLEYEEPVPNDPFSYAYGAILSGTPSEVTFTFNRTDKLRLNNSISLTNVPFIRLQAGSKITNDVNYTYTSSISDATAAQIRIFLISIGGENIGKQYDATIFNNQYYFTDVPQGTYILRSMATITIDRLAEPNGMAGGSISACKVYELGQVKVE